MIINEWGEVFTAKYGGDFPRSYMCVDTEFTGSNERDDFIVEIGHTMVEDCKVVDELNVVLNWYPTKYVEEGWLDYKLNNMRHIIGAGWRLTPAVVKAEGMDPVKALRFYHKLFATWSKRGLPFVAQNGQTADERLLRGNFNRFINKPFEFPDNGYFDTGGIYKANKLWTSDSPDHTHLKAIMLPHRSDTLKAYFHRVIFTRVAGLKWNMKAMLDEYGIREKYNMKDEQFHTAGFDAKCLHYVMQEYRKEAAEGAKSVLSPLEEAPIRTPSLPTIKPEEKPKPEAKAKRKTPSSPKTGKKRKRKQRVI